MSLMSLRMEKANSDKQKTAQGTSPYAIFFVLNESYSTY